MAIRQGSDRAVVNWQSFNIGKEASVSIVQPGSQSVLLNRVTGESPSQIFGQLSANGQVVLVNPNGVTFGKDGSVSAAGFTASTLGISDADFMASRMRYERNGSTAGIVQQGKIATQGGYVALLGASVDNEGRIETRGGAALLGAAEAIQIPLSSSGRVKLELSPAQINASVANTKDGVIVTDGGQVYMQAAALNNALASITQSGSVDTSASVAGNVHLLADHGQIKVDGSITANSTGKDDTGQARKGGDIVIGRDVESGAVARSTDVGSAHLESQRGFIETSGEYLNVNGITVLTDKWLIDPVDVEINNAGSATQAGYTQISNATINTALNAGADVVISTVGAGSASGISNPTFTGTGGNIVISGDVIKNSSGTDANASLTLQAAKNITLNKSIKSFSGKLDITMDAGLTDNTGSITLTNNLMLGIRSNGGAILFKTQNGNITVGTNFPVSSSGGDITLQSAGSSTIEAYSNVDAGTGNVIFQNQGGVIRPRGLATISGKNISFDNTGGIIDPTTGSITRNPNQLTGGGIEIFNANLSAAGNVHLAGLSNSGVPGVKIQQATQQAPTYGKITAGGDIHIYGKSTGERGILAYNGGLIESTGGSVRLTGHGRATANLTDIDLQDYSVVKSAGNVELIGENTGITLTNNMSSASGVGNSSSSANLLISTDALTLSSATSAPSGTVTLSNYSTGRPVQIAGATDVVGSLNINAAEMANITASRLVVGSGNAGNVTLAGALITTMDFALITGGNLAIHSSLQTGATGTKNLTLNLTGSGSVTESGTGSLKTSNLELLGSNASYTLNNTANDAATLAANAKTVSYTDANALSIGSVNSTTGITATGTVAVATQTGNLSVTQAVGTSDTSASAIVLHAGLGSSAGTVSGGDIQLGGSYAISTGAGGRATLYTGSTSNANLTSLVGSGSGRFRYNSDENATRYTAALGSGLYAIYREAPSYTIALNGVDKTYDGQSFSGGNGYTSSGTLLNGDASAGITGTLVYGGTAQGSRHAGTYNITGSGLSSSLGYALTTTDGTLNIAKADLTLAGSRAYDGTTTFAGQHLSAIGVAGESFSVSGSGDASNLSSKHVADNQAVALASVTGLTLGSSGNGGLSSNYNSLSTTGSSVTLSKASATVTANSANSTYNGQTQTITGFTATGLVGGESESVLTGVSTSGGSGRNAGNYAHTASGTDGNYNLSFVDGALTIAKANLTLTAATDSKTYDATTTSNQTVTIGGLQSGDTITGLSQSFDSKNAGSRTLGVNAGYTVNDGNSGGNYTVSTRNATGTIARKDVTLSAMSADNKTYDGNDSAAISSGTVLGSVAGETLSVSGSGTFDTKNAGNGKTVTVNDVALLSKDNGSGDWANYQLTTMGALTTTATISPRTLSASLVGSVSKTYDSTSNATLSAGNFSLSGFVTGEGASVSQTIGTYASANVDANGGNGAVSAHLLPGQFSANAGTLLSNYVLPVSASGNVGTITPAALTIKVNNTTAFVTQDAHAATNNGYSYTGWQGLDSEATALGRVPVASDRTYSGATYPVAGTYSGVYGLGYTPTAQHGNYSVTVQSGDLRVIPADQLLIHVASQADIYGNRSASTAGQARSVTAQYCLAAGNCSGANLYTLNMGSNDGIRWSGTDNTGTTVQFDTSVATAGHLSQGGYLRVGNYAWTAANMTSSHSGQFNGHAVDSGVLAIQRLAVAPTADAIRKVYDGTAWTADRIALKLPQVLAGDAVSAVADSGNYSTKNVIASDTVALGNLSLQGADKDNYALSVSSVVGTGVIVPKPINVSGITASDKVYDGSTAAHVNAAAARFNGLVNGDDVSVSAHGSFTDKNAGVGKQVALASTYSGMDLGNYTITDQAAASATIHKAALTLTGNSLRTVYTGQMQQVTGYTVNGLQGTDTVADLLGVQASGAFGRDAGLYTNSVTAAQQTNYDVTVINGSLQIDNANPNPIPNSPRASLPATYVPDARLPATQITRLSLAGFGSAGAAVGQVGHRPSWVKLGTTASLMACSSDGAADDCICQDTPHSDVEICRAPGARPQDKKP
jgi:filamentous hemagglutinin family protein